MRATKRLDLMVKLGSNMVSVSLMPASDGEWFPLLVLLYNGY